MPSLKEEVKKALDATDFAWIERLARENKKVFSILISLTYDKEDLICWRAIEAMGKAAGAVAGEAPVAVRNVVQRLIWSVSEESGGIGWSAPEMLGEIVINSPQAFEDIPPVLLSFHEEESFLKGVLWALGRMARSGIERTRGSFEVAVRALEHKDSSVRGLGLYALAGSITDEVKARVKEMIRDGGRCVIYRDGQLVETKVGDIARMVLDER